MAYSKEQIEDKFNIIISKLESGYSLRKCLIEQNMSSRTFYEWIELDNEKQKLYTCACEARADAIFEDILDIADESSKDTIYTDKGEIPNGEWMARSRLRVDSRKWMLSKLNPKEYGDKIQQDITSDGEKIQTNSLIITLPDGKIIDDFKI